MKLECNIDARGKAIRLGYGVVLLVVGIALMIWWAHPAGTWVAWTVSIAIVLAGAFAIFEARAGWCVMRAIGFKTPL